MFYYADEFNVSWLPTLRALWGPQGQQIMIPTPRQPYKRYGLGAVNYHTGETVVLFRRRKRRCETPRDLVEDDAAVIVDTEPPRARAADPNAEPDNRHDDNEAPGQRQPEQRPGR